MVPYAVPQGERALNALEISEIRLFGFDDGGAGDELECVAAVADGFDQRLDNGVRM